MAVDGWKLFFVWILPVSTLIYFVTFSRFYRKDFHWQKAQSMGWPSRFKMAMLIPLLEAIFYLLFSLGVVAFTIQGDDKGAAELMQLLLLAPLLLFAKVGSVAYGFIILPEAKSMTVGSDEAGFQALAKRQLIIIVVYSLIAAAPLIAWVLPDVYDSGPSETRIMAINNVDVCRSALASYAADSVDNRFPVGKLGYDQFRDLFPERDLPEQAQGAGFDEGAFVYDSEDGETYVIWVTSKTRGAEGSGIIRGSPSGIVPSR